MHQEWTNQLSAYLDNELAPEARERLGAHLVECEPCRQVLAELRAVVAWAPGFEGSLPERDLWPPVAKAIEAGRVVAFPGRPASRFSLAQMAAAAAVVALLSGGGVWLLVRGGPAAELARQPTPTVVGAPAIPAALFEDADYDAAVSDLEQVLEAGRGQLDSTTVRVLEENLRIIDAAIAESRAAIEADPSNAYLSTRIRSNMQRKLVILRQAARAAGAST